MIARRAVWVLLLSLAVAGCTGGSGPGSATSTLPAAGSPSVTPSGSPKPTGPSPSPPSPSPPADSGPPFVAPTATASAPASRGGKGLSVTDVRTGDQTGYDRVVFVLGGSGTVGWRVRYDADPRRQGSGSPVRLNTPATLTVLLDGVAYPMDSGVPEYSGPRTLSPALAQVRAVQLGGVFEGTFDAFVGTAGQQPFRVFRLDDPQRVVVDIARAG